MDLLKIKITLRHSSSIQPNDPQRNINWCLLITKCISLALIPFAYIIYIFFFFNLFFSFLLLFKIFIRLYSKDFFWLNPYPNTVWNLERWIPANWAVNSLFPEGTAVGSCRSGHIDLQPVGETITSTPWKKRKPKKKKKPQFLS